MRLWIRLLVIAVHVALIIIIVGPCRHPGCRLTRKQDTGKVAPGKATDAPKLPQAVSGGKLPLPSRDGATKGSELPPFSPDFFTRRDSSSGPPLKAAVADCRTGVVVDWRRRTILWGKEESKGVPIASLTKMMTTLLLMEALHDGSGLTLDTKVAVTRESASVGGRQVWLDPRESFSLQDLLRCMLIHSANDAAYLVGQKVAGSEKDFVAHMNQRATALGLRTLVFHNDHGLPEGAARDENVGSALDLAYLAGRLLDYDDVVEWSATRLSYLQPRVDGKKTQLLNTNKLIGRVPGVDGMKTGYTTKSGYCLAATCERGDRRIIAVVTGCSRADARDKLATDLLEWAYSQP